MTTNFFHGILILTLFLFEIFNFIRYANSTTFDITYWTNFRLISILMPRTSWFVVFTVLYVYIYFVASSGPVRLKAPLRSMKSSARESTYPY